MILKYDFDMNLFDEPFNYEVDNAEVLDVISKKMSKRDIVDYIFDNFSDKNIEDMKSIGLKSLDNDELDWAIEEYLELDTDALNDFIYNNNLENYVNEAFEDKAKEAYFDM